MSVLIYFIGGVVTQYAMHIEYVFIIIMVLLARVYKVRGREGGLMPSFNYFPFSIKSKSQLKNHRKFYALIIISYRNPPQTSGSTPVMISYIIVHIHHGQY